MTDQTLHSDLRAPSIPPLRAHAHAQKWKNTTHIPAPWTSTTTGSAPIPVSAPRPFKQPRLARLPHPARGSALAHARMECADLSCARGDDLVALHDGVFLPPGEPVGDEAIFYSFDEKESPASSLGLDGLVDKAERHFVERETERIVRSEYEVLDGEGERVRRRGKGSRSQSLEGEREVEGEVGGAWEAI